MPRSSVDSAPLDRSQYAVQTCCPPRRSGCTNTVPRPTNSRSRGGIGGGPTRSRSDGPNAYGSSCPKGSAPPSTSIRQLGPPCSHSSCRHRPHGISGAPEASTQDSAISRPPPLACNAETNPHSAHSVTPYDAFSTLQPTTTRPSSTSAAAPTGKLEYGA